MTWNQRIRRTLVRDGTSLQDVANHCAISPERALAHLCRMPGVLRGHGGSSSEWRRSDVHLPPPRVAPAVAQEEKVSRLRRTRVSRPKASPPPADRPTKARIDPKDQACHQDVAAALGVSPVMSWGDMMALVRQRSRPLDEQAGDLAAQREQDARGLRKLAAAIRGMGAA